MSISASGMQAASRQFSTAASRIVNLNTDAGASIPQFNQDGGPQTSLPVSRLAYNPQSIAINSDPATDMVQLREAQNSFRANLLAFKASSGLFKTLLDATA